MEISQHRDGGRTILSLGNGIDSIVFASHESPARAQRFAAARLRRLARDVEKLLKAGATADQ